MDRSRRTSAATTGRGSGNGLDTGARGRPPADASVLFDGKDLAQWDCQKAGPVKWRLENGYMEVGPKSGGLLSKAQCGDCQLHVEWAVTAVIEGTRQGRGNSGVFLMNRYEIQVLDLPKPDGRRRHHRGTLRTVSAARQRLSPAR